MVERVLDPERLKERGARHKHDVGLSRDETLRTTDTVATLLVVEFNIV